MTDPFAVLVSRGKNKRLADLVDGLDFVERPTIENIHALLAVSLVAPGPISVLIRPSVNA